MDITVLLNQYFDKETVAIIVFAIWLVTSEVMPFVKAVQANGLLHALYLRITKPK